MKKTTLLFTLIFIIALTGCNSKRQYFEPENINGDLKLSKNLPSKIVNVSNGGATLKNGNIITQDGIDTNTKLKDGFFLLNKSNDRIVLADINGNLMVTDFEGNEIFSRSFPVSIVSANAQNNLLAVVSAANHIYLIDIFNATTLMEYKSSEISAIDSRVASPIFLSTIIIYPSLDGKIYIVNRSNGQILRDIVVSSENFFNNVTFLDVVGDYMIASTAKRVIVINPAKTTYFDSEIKDVLVNDYKIYVFAKDGKVTKLDFNLNKLSEAYFKFAIFSDSTIHNNNLYIIEKTGYIIKTDLDLKNSQILKLNKEIKNKSFTSKDAFYYNDEFVNFE